MSSLIDIQYILIWRAKHSLQCIDMNEIDMKEKLTLVNWWKINPSTASQIRDALVVLMRIKFLVDIIARRKVRVEFRLSQVHFRVPVVPLFLHQNTIIYPGKCGPFGNLGGAYAPVAPPLRTGLRYTLENQPVKVSGFITLCPVVS